MGTVVITATTSDLPVIPPPSSLSPVPPSLVWLTVPTTPPPVVIQAPPRPRPTAPPTTPAPETTPVPETPAPTTAAPETTPIPSDPPTTPTPGTEIIMTTPIRAVSVGDLCRATLHEDPVAVARAMRTWFDDPDTASTAITWLEELGDALGELCRDG
jgi:hypothetical protein